VSTTKGSIGPLALLFWVVLATSVLMAVLASTPARAATYTVTNTNDSGPGSLRQAIMSANASGGVADTIVFAPSLSGQTISLDSQLPNITGAALTVDGGSMDITVTNAQGEERVFMVGSDPRNFPRREGKLTLNNLTITNGFAVDGSGGGVYNGEGSTLVVKNSTISDNTADRGGGGIFNAGNLVVLSSTIAQNDNKSDIPYSGGGISSVSDSSLTVSNSTIFDNTTDTNGGGISSETADARVWNTTIVGNKSVTGGAGIFAGEFASSHVTLWNTILASNVNENSVRSVELNCMPKQAVINGGNNLDTGATCGFGTAKDSLSNTDPQLSGFADHGGPTETISLMAGSPAVNHGNNAFAVDPLGTVGPGGDTLQFDQRGEDFERIVGGTVDIGAFEVQGLGSEPPPAEVPENKQACKKGGYEEFGFRNQGLCIKAVNHAD
jgi:hypothetical protein